MRSARACITFLTSWTVLAAVVPTGLTAQQPAPVQEIAPDVQRLLWMDSRDAALARIVARGAYRGPGTYTEDDKKLTVRNVVVCPQPVGPPLFAVFVTSRNLEEKGIRIIRSDAYNSRPIGHLIQVAADGTIVRCPGSNNVVDGTFADINSDGVIERVESISYTDIEDTELKVHEVCVQPVVEGAMPSLRVAYSAGDAPALTWRAIPTEGKAPSRVQLVRPPEPGLQRERIVATWTWNKELRQWTGPGGGPGQEFMRLPPDGYAELKEFALQKPSDSRKDD